MLFLLFLPSIGLWLANAILVTGCSRLDIGTRFWWAETVTERGTVAGKLTPRYLAHVLPGRTAKVLLLSSTTFYRDCRSSNRLQSPKNLQRTWKAVALEETLFMSIYPAVSSEKRSIVTIGRFRNLKLRSVRSEFFCSETSSCVNNN